MTPPSILLAFLLPSAGLCAPPPMPAAKPAAKAPAKPAAQSAPASAEEGSRLAEQADALRKKGDQKQAIGLYIRALEIYDEVLAEDDMRIAAALDGLSRSLEMQGLYEDAAKMGLKAARIVATVKGPRHLDVAYAAERLARLSALDKKFAQSTAYYEQALSIESQTFGPDDPSLLPLLEEYLGILRRTPRKADIAKVEGRIASLRAKSSGKK